MTHGHRWLVGTGVVLALAAALALMGFGGPKSLAVDDIIYVDADADPGGDGSTWDDAYTDLQDALTDARAGSAAQIWVAAGTYKPTDGTDRIISFEMVNGVVLYGGFAGGETELGQRDWVANPTILSGDIGIEDDASDNSYHVFYHSSELELDGTAILDGFTITGGNANGYRWPHNHGGGMYNYVSSPTLTNCTFEGNSATNGGGMCNLSSSPTLTNCTFTGNSADWTGGGIYNEGNPSPNVTNCAFAANSATYGGGMCSNDSSPKVTDCTFWGNSAEWGGGIVNWQYSSPMVTNCTFAGNSASTEGGGMYNNDSSPMVTNCTFAGNSASDSGGGIYNDSSSPIVTNCILWWDSPDEISGDTGTVTWSDIQGSYADPEGTNIDADPLFVDRGSGDFHLWACSPCIDAGTFEVLGLPRYDFEGDPRIIDGDGDGYDDVDMGVDEVAVPGTCSRVYLPLVLRNY